MKQSMLFYVTQGSKENCRGKRSIFFDLREDLFLDVMSDNQSLEGVLAKLLSRLKGMLGSLPVDGILVQGDTITAYAGALVAYFNKIPLFSFGGRVKIFESFRTHAGRGLKADD